MIIIFLIGVIAGVTIIIFKLINKKWGLRVALSGASIIPLVLLSMLLRSIYPGDDFFHNEFRSVLGIETPTTAKVIKKSASYPIFHPDYLSSTRIQFSTQDYLIIMDSVDSCYVPTEEVRFGGFKELKHVLGSTKRSEIVSQYEVDLEMGVSGGIYFLNDYRTVIIYKIVV